MCIFSTPPLFAGIKEIYQEEYEALKQDEKILGFTLDNKKCLDDFVGEAESCVYWKDKAAVRSIQTGVFAVKDICEELEISGRSISRSRRRPVLGTDQKFKSLQVKVKQKFVSFENFAVKVCHEFKSF